MGAGGAHIKEIRVVKLGQTSITHVLLEMALKEVLNTWFGNYLSHPDPFPCITY